MRRILRTAVVLGVLGALGTSCDKPPREPTEQTLPAIDPHNLDQILERYELDTHIPSIIEGPLGSVSTSHPLNYRILSEKGGYTNGTVDIPDWLKPGMIGPYDMTECRSALECMGSPNPSPEEIADAEKRLQLMREDRAVYDRTVQTFSVHFPERPEGSLFIFAKGERLFNGSYWAPLTYVATDTTGRASFQFSTSPELWEISELTAVNPVTKAYKPVLPE